MRVGPASVLVSLALSAGACADASERFKAFEDRRVALGGDAGATSSGLGGADAGCQPPAPGVVAGPALLSLETSTSPGAAILFFGDLETPELDGKTAVKFSYRALAVADRLTQVGEELVVGPYAIGDDGKFDAPTPESTLPGSANAILPGVDITSQLTLHGTICGVADFYCGTVTGTVSAPVQGDTTGNFGITLVGSLDDLPARPRYGCDPEALAPALP
ncbi:MAG: hypothetical protein K0R38_990 [Polyangiaceae bacterium]|jgi:hypothetical protein|nr:hypothetical protein [Polyangiaceae bacterium]